MKAERTCGTCSASLAGMRESARYCGDTCRVRASRSLSRCTHCDAPVCTLANPVCARCQYEESHLGQKLTLRGFLEWTDERDICLYCGEFSQKREHVPSRRRAVAAWKVPTCRECALLSRGSGKPVLERSDDIRHGRMRKYGRALKVPEWSDEELQEMDGHMATALRGWQLARDTVLQQIRWNIRDMISDVDSYDPQGHM